MPWITTSASALLPGGANGTFMNVVSELMGMANQSFLDAVCRAMARREVGGLRRPARQPVVPDLDAPGHVLAAESDPEKLLRHRGQVGTVHARRQQQHA